MKLDVDDQLIFSLINHLPETKICNYSPKTIPGLVFTESGLSAIVSALAMALEKSRPAASWFLTSSRKRPACKIQQKTYCSSLDHGELPLTTICTPRFMSTISLLLTLEQVFRLAKNNGEVEDDDRITMYPVASLLCRY